jgi:hypothetical protein
MKVSNSTEFRAFRDLTDRLLAVPHAEIKKKLEEEKTTKKRKKAKQSSASGRVAGDRV